MVPRLIHIADAVQFLIVNCGPSYLLRSRPGHSGSMGQGWMTRGTVLGILARANRPPYAPFPPWPRVPVDAEDIIFSFLLAPLHRDIDRVDGSRSFWADLDL